MNPQNRFSCPSLVTFANCAGFLAGALVLWLLSALVGVLPLSFGDALVHLPMLMGGDLIFLLAWFAAWSAIGIVVGMRVTRNRRHAPSPALLSERSKLHRKNSFTLIELLIVIAIIAVLAVVVIITLNPAQMMAQARDSNRVSDFRTLNDALNLYSEDVGTGMGSSSVVYVSVPDPTATTAAGSDCSGLGLSSSSLPAGWTWHCAGPNYYRKVDGTGWIPVDFTRMSTGSPMGSLPVDPVNATSSGLYYAYVANGDRYELTALMESSKYAMGGSNDVESTDGGQYADLYEVGTDLKLDPIDYNPSLVGYWRLDEGLGTIAYDASGHGNNGTWSGTEAGTSGYYSAGHDQTWAGNFDGSTDYISISGGSALAASTFSAWVNPQTLSGIERIVVAHGQYFTMNGTSVGTYITGLSLAQNFFPSLATSTWSLVTATWDGSTVRIYVNTNLVGSWNATGITSSFYMGSIGNCAACGNINWFPGLIDDVRIYNRALSASEIQAIYNAEK